MRRIVSLLFAIALVAGCSGTDGGSSSDQCDAFKKCRESVCDWAASGSGYHHSDADCYRASSADDLKSWCQGAADSTEDPQQCIDRASRCENAC